MTIHTSTPLKSRVEVRPWTGLERYLLLLASLKAIYINLKPPQNGRINDNLRLHLNILLAQCEAQSQAPGLELHRRGMRAVAGTPAKVSQCPTMKHMIDNKG
jgi:hypothetical protein